MTVRVCAYELQRLELRTRLPFRYGIATMTDVPLIFVRVTAEFDGKHARGISSDSLPPKWFTKVPEKPLQEELDEMLEVIQRACGVSTHMRGESVYDFWRQLYEGQLAWARARKIPPLLANFGTSLVERALIDAWCRSAETSFWQLPEVQAIRARPLSQIMIRHTVGLSDPLTDSDITEGERLSDGLPQSLEQSIRRYGLEHLKIKLSGNLDQDLDRLERIAAMLATHKFAFSLDGNEQFKSMPDFRVYWETVTGKLPAFFQHLLFVEQPLHRDVALRDDVGDALRRWPKRPSIIIDESDATLEDLPRALELGYSGTSHKNCKGVFKGIASARRRPAILSGEDLCNIGPVALLQDLAVMAALGIQSVERNGHHYHAGLSQLPKSMQEQVLDHHADLYERSAQGWPTLKIRAGQIDLRSVNAAPFGTSVVI